MPGTTFIYALCEPGARTPRYFGRSTCPRRRRGQHVRVSSRENTPLGEWLRDISDSGGPEIVTLREVLTEDGLKTEKRYIRAAKSLGVRLVNSNNGGGGPLKHTPETKALMSALKMGEKHHFFGKNLPAEHRANISAGRMGDSHPHKGVPRSPECRAKLSAALSGENNPNFGKICPPETREKIREKNKGVGLGVPKSPEFKERVRMTMLALRAAEREYNAQS